MLRVKSKAKGVELGVATDYTGYTDVDLNRYGFEIYADELRLRQIVVNLLANAIKFTSVGSIIALIKIVKLHTASADQPNARITIAVTDTGCGISETDIAKLF